jgi:hypothetical protein
VAAGLGHRQAPFAAELLHPQEVGDQLHLLLDRRQAHQGVELGQQLLERPGRGLRRRVRTGRHRLARRRGPGHVAARPAQAGPVDGPQQHAAEAVEGGQLRFGRDGVGGAHRVGQVHGPLVVAPRVVRAVGPVGLDQHVEEERGGGQPGPLARHEAGGPHVGRRGVGQGGRHPGGERADEGPQLVVGEPPVDVDEGGGQVVGLVDHVELGLPGREAGHRLAGDAGQHGRQLLHEALDRLGQDVGAHGPSVWPTAPHPSRLSSRGTD